MTVIGTCGHELKDVKGNEFAIKEYQMGEKVVCYISVCDECAKWYRRHRSHILKTDEAKNKWLQEGD